jgi:hypothetical protein
VRGLHLAGSVVGDDPLAVAGDPSLLPADNVWLLGGLWRESVLLFF